MSIDPDKQKKMPIGSIKFLEEPKLAIETKPAGCLITIDGKSFEKSPVSAELKAGQYSIKAECEGFKTWEKRIFFDGKGDADLEIKLSKIPKPTMKLHEAAKTGNLEQVKRNFSNGARLNAKNHWDETPLHLASRYGHIETARFLIDNDADVNAENRSYSTPLLYAVNKGQTEITKLLLDYGARLNATNHCGETSLHLAADEGQTEMAKLLLDNGADVNAKNGWDKTPLNIADENGDTDTAYLLRRHGGR